jgi:hypothetical protein
MNKQTMRSSKIHAIWLGPASGEFQRPFELLQTRTQLRLCADLKTLSQWATLPNLTPPEFVFSASVWPGAWQAPKLEELSRHWPLTRWVELVGAWSQGAARTAPSWSGWQQVPAGEFQFSLDQFLATGSPPLPRTMTREERLLCRTPSALRQGTRVGVFSRQRNQILPLLELLESIGCFGVGHWQQGADLQLGDEDSWREFSPEVLVVNLSTELAAALPWLLAIRSRWPKMPLILLADVPRVQELELASAHELGPLLGKPVDAACLATALQSVLSKSQRMVH